MNNSKSIVQWAVIGGVLVLAGFLASHALAKAPAPAPAPAPVVKTLGAVTSADSLPDRVCSNGVCTWTERSSFIAASTTLCAIPNPNPSLGNASTTVVGNVSGSAYVGTATTTLVSLSVINYTSTSTAYHFDVSTSTTAFGSSTPAFLYFSSVAANTQFEKVWTGVGSTTPTQTLVPTQVDGSSNFIVKPFEFVTVKVAENGNFVSTGGGYPVNNGGQCIAVFRSNQFI